MFCQLFYFVLFCKCCNVPPYLCLFKFFSIAFLMASFSGSTLKSSALFAFVRFFVCSFHSGIFSLHDYIEICLMRDKLRYKVFDGSNGFIFYSSFSVMLCVIAICAKLRSDSVFKIIIICIILNYVVFYFRSSLSFCQVSVIKTRSSA